MAPVMTHTNEPEKNRKKTTNPDELERIPVA